MPELWILLANTLIGLALRIDYLFQPMRYDESATYLSYASRPLRVGLSHYFAPNNHLFHTLLVHAATLVFGGAPWAIRLPALIAGTLMIPAAFLMASEFFGTGVGIVTSALVASSSALIEYSTNARGYTIVSLCFLLALALARNLGTANDPRRWYGLSVIFAIGFYTVPIMLFPFGIVMLWLVFDQIPGVFGPQRGIFYRYALRSIALTSLLVLLLYLPVLVTAGWRSLFANRFVMPSQNFQQELVRSIGWIRELANRDFPRLLRIALEVGVALALVQLRRFAGEPLRLAAAAILWCSAVLIVMRVVPYPRVWLFLLPLYFAFAAAGWSGLARWIPGRAIYLAPALALALGLHTIATGSVLLSPATGTLRDAEQITLFLKPRLTDSSRVLSEVPSDAILEYYFARYDVPKGRLVATIGPYDARCYVVVNLTEQQSLAAMLAKAGVPNLPKSATIVATYPTARIYDVEFAPSSVNGGA